MSFRYPQVKNHEKWPPAVRFTNSTPKVFNTEKSQAPHNQRLVGFIKRSYFQFVIRLKVAARAGVVLRSQTSCPTPATRRSRKCRVVRPLAGEACSQKETSRGKTGGFRKWLLGLGEFNAERVSQTPATRQSRKCRVVRPLAGEACSQKETSRG